MPEREERVLTAQLHPADLMNVYGYVCVATEKSREDRHCLDTAYHEISKILGVSREVGKDVSFDNLEKIQKKGLDQYGFSHSTTIGISIAIGQYLTGESHPKKLKADVSARMDVLELAACFSKKFVELVKKRAKLQDVKPSDVKLEDVFDEEPEAKASK